MSLRGGQRPTRPSRLWRNPGTFWIATAALQPRDDGVLFRAKLSILRQAHDEAPGIGVGNGLAGLSGGVGKNQDENNRKAPTDENEPDSVYQEFRARHFAPGPPEGYEDGPVSRPAQEQEDRHKKEGKSNAQDLNTYCKQARLADHPYAPSSYASETGAATVFPDQ